MGAVTTFGTRIRLAVGCSALALASGCATLEFGAPIRVDRLDTLTRHVSTRSDVLLALGEPGGTGGMRFNPQRGLRGVWFYEHIRAEASPGGSSQKVTILLVVFDGDRYDGHYWFGEDVRAMRR